VRGMGRKIEKMTVTHLSCAAVEGDPVSSVENLAADFKSLVFITQLSWIFQHTNSPACRNTNNSKAWIKDSEAYNLKIVCISV
jgi:hypothetical protein